MKPRMIILPIFLCLICLKIMRQCLPGSDNKHERNVVFLNGSNFTQFIYNHMFVMVEFYAPSCEHCHAMEPEYAAAAEAMKDEAVLAKVDATEEVELSRAYNVRGSPTVYLFVAGAHQPYRGQLTKDAIVTWLRKKARRGLHNITTIEEAERMLKDEDRLVLGYFKSLVGPESNELAAASEHEYDVFIYQTTSSDVAKWFHIDPNSQPALIFFEKEPKTVDHFGDQFTGMAIAQFLFESKRPPVTNFTRETHWQFYGNSSKKQLMLFATSEDSEKLYPMFLGAARIYKGQLLFLYIELDNEDVGGFSEYIGVSQEAPSVLAFTGHLKDWKFLLEGELTLNSIISFAKKFLQDDELKPFYKSEPIPENEDGDVKIVVANNFDKIVLDESKDVLLQLYAPGRMRSQSLEPIYDELGKHLRGIDSLVIAKMDATKNEHPKAETGYYPKLLFFPAGNKSSNPIIADTDHTVVALIQFLKKYASISFKVQKSSSRESTTFDNTITSHGSSIDLKDEQ